MKLCLQLDRRRNICVKKVLQLKCLNVHDKCLQFILSDISDFAIINALTILSKKISSEKHNKILLRLQKFSQTKLLPNGYYYPRNIFTLRLLPNNRKFQGEVTKFTYFSPTILLDLLPISTVKRKRILKLIVKLKLLQKSLLITHLKYQMAAVFPVSVTTPQGSCCREKIIF